MNRRNLILIGGGGHCKSVIDVAELAGYNIVGILDVPEAAGTSILDYDVIGTDDDILQYADKTEFIIAVGFIKNPSVRLRIYNEVKRVGGKLATIVSPTAHVSRYATLGEGTVVMHHAVVNAGVQVGVNCIINTFCDIEHDVFIGDQCHISTGTMVNGNCMIGNRVFVGSQSVLVNGITIGEDIVVGAGSVVIKSIFEKGIYAGNPAILKV